MERFFQSLFIVSTLGLSWLSMMVVHEAGHVLHSRLSGGKIERVILHPLSFSQTRLADSPHPLFVAWGGPIWGCLMPLAFMGVVRYLKLRYWYLGAFFAGFCLIANGAYIGVGSFMSAGDAGDLMSHGSPQWQLIGFGLPTFAAGLWLWHGLGQYFGLGTGASHVDKQATAGLTAATVMLILIEFLYGL